jgi:hypothetical protein
VNIILSLVNDTYTARFVRPEEDDIDALKLFVSKQITNDVAITIEKNAHRFNLTKIRETGFDKNEFTAYRLISEFPVSGDYSLYVDNTDVGTITLSDGSHLIDEHSPVLVNGRRIGPVTTEIIAQDVYSQQITFLMKKKYDGISFIDEASYKRLYVDFIPVDKELLKITDETGKIITIPFLSDRIEFANITTTLAPAGQSGEWVLIKWDLPYAATKDAGTIPFSLSVIDTDSDHPYIWQTFSSSFTVSPSLGIRQGINVPALIIPEGILEERVAAIEETLGYQTDMALENDRDILFSGGGAPIEN